MTHIIIYRSPAGVHRLALSSRTAQTNWHAAHWISVHEPCSIRDVEILCFLPMKWARGTSDKIYEQAKAGEKVEVWWRYPSGWRELLWELLGRPDYLAVPPKRVASAP